MNLYTATDVRRYRGSVDVHAHLQRQRCLLVAATLKLVYAAPLVLYASTTSESHQAGIAVIIIKGGQRPTPLYECRLV